MEDKDALILVNPKEAARMLSVSPRKLWAITFEDKPALPHVKMGRLVRYPVAEIHRWIETLQREGGSDAR